jgi:ATP-dependent DNA ligase
MVEAPDWFEAPMLCKTTQRETLDIEGRWDGYVAEPKHDGTRCLVVNRAGEGVRLYSRSGQDYTEHVPHLVAELTGWLPEDSIIDGELAVIARTLYVGGESVPVTDFNKTMRIMGSLAERGRELQDDSGELISLVVYDMPQWKGTDWTGEHFSDRREGLEEGFPLSDHLFLNPQYDDPSNFGELFDTLVGNGVEGIIVKNIESGYVLGSRPNNTWYKVKAAVTMDMVVSGYTEGTGKFAGLIGALEFSRTGPDGELVYVGRCSGMTDAMRREITDNRDTYLGQVVEIKSNELVGSKEYRSPRHPQFVCFRTDKRPEDCDGQELRTAAS